MSARWCAIPKKVRSGRLRQLHHRARVRADGGALAVALAAFMKVLRWLQPCRPDPLRSANFAALFGVPEISKGAEKLPGAGPSAAPPPVLHRGQAGISRWGQGTSGIQTDVPHRSIERNTREQLDTMTIAVPVWGMRRFRRDTLVSDFLPASVAVKYSDSRLRLAPAFPGPREYSFGYVQGKSTISRNRGPAFSFVQEAFSPLTSICSRISSRRRQWRGSCMAERASESEMQVLSALWDEAPQTAADLTSRIGKINRLDAGNGEDPARTAGPEGRRHCRGRWPALPP